MIKKPRRNDNLDQLCNISFPRQVFRPLSVQEQLPNSGSKSKRPRKQTAVMTESLHQEETLSPKKKQKKKEPTSKDGKRQSKKGLAKKAEEASAIRDGIEILNSLPAFQTNFPSRSKESTTSQNSQLSLVGASSPNMSQLPSVHTTPQLSQLPSVLPSAQWPQQSQLCALQFSALQQRELPVKSNPPSNQLPVHSVPPNQPIQSVLQNQLPVQSAPHSNQMSVGQLLHPQTSRLYILYRQISPFNQFCKTSFPFSLLHILTRCPYQLLHPQTNRPYILYRQISPFNQFCKTSFPFTLLHILTRCPYQLLHPQTSRPYILYRQISPFNQFCKTSFSLLHILTSGLHNRLCLSTSCSHNLQLPQTSCYLLPHHQDGHRRHYRMTMNHHHHRRHRHRHHLFNFSYPHPKPD